MIKQDDRTLEQKTSHVWAVVAQVAHLWAHQVKPSANGSHFYFEGDTIYSYGAHFPIARHVTNKSGVNAILFTSRGYSSSTSIHIGYTRSAIPQSVPVFYVLDPEQKPGSADLTRFTENAVEYVTESRQPRKTEQAKARLIGQAQDEIRKATEFAAFFGLPYTPPGDVLALADEWQAEIERENKRRAAKAKRDANKARREAKEKISEFIGGESDRVPNIIPEAYARIKRIESYPDGDLMLKACDVPELETSKGARVPLDGIRKILPRLKRILEAGKAWKTNGVKLPVRPYQIDEIRADGTVIAGCHQFQKAEALRIMAMVEKYYA